MKAYSHIGFQFVPSGMPFSEVTGCPLQKVAIYRFPLKLPLSEVPKREIEDALFCIFLGNITLECNLPRTQVRGGVEKPLVTGGTEVAFIGNA